MEGTYLGDVWPHSALPSHTPYVPFHKLTQWLCYSLLEPLQQEGGLSISNTHLQTGVFLIPFFQEIFILSLFFLFVSIKGFLNTEMEGCLLTLG